MAIAVAVFWFMAAVLPAHAFAADTEPAEPAQAGSTDALSPDSLAFAPMQAEASPMGAAATPRLWLEGDVETIQGVRPQVVQGRISTGLADVSNRVWLGWGRAAVGFGLGAQSLRGDRPVGIGAGIDPAAAVLPARPSMSVGLRYEMTASSSLYAGASAARAWGGEDALPLYRAKAGVEWKSAKSRLGFDGGRLGLQLDSGYRMSIRTRSGGVQIALRRTF